MVGTCSLCLIPKPLQRRSHIIPQFMYKPLMENGHEFVSFNPVQAALNKDYKGKKIHARTGEYDEYILCRECENEILNRRYEDYAKRVIYGNSVARSDDPVITGKLYGGNRITVLTTVDYTRFKLFLLSILWRASISRRPFFNEVNLGPHSETIRKMILSGIAGPTDAYPIMFTTYADDPTGPIQLIAPLVGGKGYVGHTIYLFPIGGMIYTFIISNSNYYRPIPKDILNFCISESGKFEILHLKQGSGYQFINSLYGIDTLRKDILFE